MQLRVCMVTVEKVLKKLSRALLFSLLQLFSVEF